MRRPERPMCRPEIRPEHGSIDLSEHSNDAIITYNIISLGILARRLPPYNVAEPPPAQPQLHTLTLAPDCP